MEFSRQEYWSRLPFPSPGPAKREAMLDDTGLGASQVALLVKNPSANADDIRDVGSIPDLGRYPGGGPGNSLQYSGLENPMDRGAWRAIVYRVAKSQTQLKRLSTQTQEGDRKAKGWSYKRKGS